MPDLEFEVKGLKELFDALEQVPAKLENNILRGAIRAGSKPIVEEARRRAPVLKSLDPRRVFGALAKSIRARAVRMRGGLLMGGVVAGGAATVGRGADKVQAEPFYARFVEFGTAKNPPQAFLRPAVDTRVPAAIDATADYIRGRVEAGDVTK
jgi:HK97 gp10 family phage protein